MEFVSSAYCNMTTPYAKKVLKTRFKRSDMDILSDQRRLAIEERFASCVMFGGGASVHCIEAISCLSKKVNLQIW